MGWRIYEAGVFEHMTEHEVLALAQDALPQQVYAEAAELSERASAAGNRHDRNELGGQAEALTKWAKRCEMRRTLTDALESLKGRVIVPVDAWDADPWLFNVENGVLDLRSQTLREHRPADRMTKQAPVRFDPDAHHPAFDALLALLRRDGREDFLRRAFGSALSGSRLAEVLIYLLGDAGTAKSTLAEALMGTLGPYATTIDTRTLLESRFSQAGAPRADLHKLRGARLAIGRELPKRGRLNASDLKALTGGDTITARAPYAREAIDFKPTFLLAVHSNYALSAEWDDPGVRRRLMITPFNVKPEHPDPDVKNALVNDLHARSATLNWLLAGLAEWIADDYRLEPPAIVTNATREYWRDQDPFAEWAEQHLNVDGITFTTTAALYASYRTWADAARLHPQSRDSLGRWLAQQPHLTPERTRTGRGWRGARLSVTPSVTPTNPDRDGEYSTDRN